MKKSVLLFILLLSFSGCWKKQDHQITAPEIPSYSLNGTILDLSTYEPLPDIIVEISAVDLVYDVDFSTARDTSLTDGSYQFEKITPGQYSITCLRNSFPVIAQTLVMEHNDKVFDMDLPLPLLSRVNYGPPSWPAFSGICTKEAGIIAGVGTYKMIWTGDYTNKFELYGTNTYANQNPQMGALAFLGRFWCSGMGDKKNIVYSIDPARGNIEGQTTTTFNIRDMSSNGINLFATNDLGKIVKFGNHPSIVEAILDIPLMQPYGLACEGSQFWVSDYQTNYIYQLDASQKISAVYRPFTFWEGQGIVPVNGLLYLTFDPLGYIFANDGNYVYKYKVER